MLHVNLKNRVQIEMFLTNFPEIHPNSHVETIFLFTCINPLILKSVVLSYGHRMTFGQWLLYRNVNISPRPAK